MSGAHGLNGQYRARGEATIQAGDREVEVLFTNRALVDAERRLGKSVIGVARGFADGESGITEIAELLRAGMEAARREARIGGRVVTLNNALAVLDEVGFAAVAEAVMNAVADVLSFDAHGLNGQYRAAEEDEKNS